MAQDAPGGGEKTEDPTPKKLRDAREEGQVAMSPEINSTVLLLLGLLALLIFGPLFYQAFATALRQSLLENIRWDGSVNELSAILLQQFGGPGSVLLAFASLAAIAAFVVVCAQVGLTVTLKPLIPKPDKLNPLTGFKRLFGLRGLVKFLVNLAKLILVLVIAVWYLRDIIPEQIVFKPDLAERFAAVCWMILLFGIILVAVLLVVAICDMVYQRWQHHKDMMMTKQEIKEEMKQSEGDPLVKGKIRQIQRRMAQQRMMQEVPSADVVITNPTHVAVALRYDQHTMHAPICVAKGYDLVAQRIKRIAAEHGVVQVENIDLARALAKKVEIGAPIPVDFFKQVAEVLTYVYRLKGRKRA
jgi:flagellar biosynthetic protein FlhB